MEETAKKVAVLKSANMSLGINTLMKLIQDAAKVLATAGFDMEIVEKHHRLKLDAPSGTALALADSLNEGLKRWIISIIILMTAARDVRCVMIKKSVFLLYEAVRSWESMK